MDGPNPVIITVDDACVDNEAAMARVAARCVQAGLGKVKTLVQVGIISGVADGVAIERLRADAEIVSVEVDEGKRALEP